MKIEFYFKNDPDKKIHTIENVKKVNLKTPRKEKNVEEIVALFKELGKKKNHSVRINKNCKEVANG